MLACLQLFHTPVDQTVRPILDEAVQDTQTDAERIRAVLAINVLDPSMGSGHFPVEVTEYIARYLVELGVQPEESDEAFVTNATRVTDGTGEADLTYWKRRVAQQCIYGVDLNPLAVELAKLSLWLVTAARDRPLSFLDHHLRTGNALIGSWLNEVAAGQHPKAKSARKRAKQAEEAQKEAGQLALSLLDDEFRQDTSHALDSIAAIERNRGITIKDVKAQEAAYEQLRHSFSEKYLNLANLGAALYYNLEIGPDVWRPMAGYALKRNVEDARLQQFDSWLDQAILLAEKKAFFHWELEFPNIFFDSEGQPLGERAGFDVVIGNPPYVRQEQLSVDKPFFQDRYEVYHGVADLFVYFFAQGLRLLRKNGRLAYISSNAWLRANYATPLRQYLRTQTTIETIVDLGDNRVFADAPDMTPAIQVVQKIVPSNGYTAQVAVFGRGEGISSFGERLDDKLFPLSIHDQLDTGWQLTSDTIRTLFTKLASIGKSLGEVIEGKLYYGVKTGLNDAFMINHVIREQLMKDDPASATIIKSLVRGEDLRPWYQESEGRWLIFARRGIDINIYPAIKAYLQRFREQLEPRPSDWDNNYGWLGRKPGPYKWYEIQDPVEYYDAFDKPKILWPGIAKFPRFSWNEQGEIINDAGFFLLPTDISLLGLLQSRVSWFCITKICASLGERAGSIRYQQKIQFITRLPIPPLTDPQRTRIGNLAQRLTETARERYDVRRKTTHRIEHDLGTPNAKLNQRLTEWWELSFQEFRGELMKVFKRDIPLRDRDDWEALLRKRTAEIERLTGEIVALETELNTAVYDAFGLDEAERKLIEEETKYRYGEW